MKLTPDQIVRARAWRRIGRPTEWIARQFGCTADTVFRIVDPEWRENRNRDVRTAKLRRRRLTPVSGHGLLVTPHARAPAHVLAERERRLSIIQTPNQSVLGDPPLGQSALDRMRGTHA